MIERHGLDAGWQEPVLLDQRNRVEMFHVMPGGAAESVNGDHESWWVVLKGDVRFEIAGDVVDASKGSVVYSSDGEFSAITGDGSQFRDLRRGRRSGYLLKRSLET